MDREPQSGELVPTKLRCSGCKATHVIALTAERPIRRELAKTSCPTCSRRGLMQLARPLPAPSLEPQRIGMYDEPPDELGDEDLLERMARSRAVRRH